MEQDSVCPAVSIFSFPRTGKGVATNTFERAAIKAKFSNIFGMVSIKYLFIFNITNISALHILPCEVKGELSYLSGINTPICLETLDHEILERWPYIWKTPNSISYIYIFISLKKKQELMTLLSF